MHVINVMASSLDARIGAHMQEGDEERQIVGLSNAKDQALLRRHIEGTEAIIVGATSIHANRACLDHPGVGGMYPVWYIFARSPIPEHYEFWQQKHIPRVLVSADPLPIVPGSGVKNLLYRKAERATFLHGHMVSQGYKRALLFGGGVVNSWFYEQGLVNQLELTLAPLMIGRPDAPHLVAPQLSQAVQFLLVSSQVSESFVFLSYSVTPIG
jgi:riboflavin biosynthesis pyrimidine reductase